MCAGAEQQHEMLSWLIMSSSEMLAKAHVFTPQAHSSGDPRGLPMEACLDLVVSEDPELRQSAGNFLDAAAGGVLRMLRRNKVLGHVCLAAGAHAAALRQQRVIQRREAGSEALLFVALRLGEAQMRGGVCVAALRVAPAVATHRSAKAAALASHLGQAQPVVGCLIDCPRPDAAGADAAGVLWGARLGAV